VKRLLDFVFIALVSTFTIFATGITIHDAHAHQPNPFSTYLHTEWNSLYRRLSGSGIVHSLHKESTNPTTQSAPPSPSLTQPRTGSNSPDARSGSQAKSMTTGATGATDPLGASSVTWSASDVTEVERIAAQLRSGLTLGESMNLLSAFQQPGPSQAAQAVQTYVRTHLSLQDQRWLFSHFSGSTGFSGEDVVLLQQAASEIQATLTSGERQLFGQQLSAYLRQH